MGVMKVGDKFHFDVQIIEITSIEENRLYYKYLTWEFAHAPLEIPLSFFKTLDLPKISPLTEALL